ncbi:alkaline phosphatase family protein [Spirobacillus cienkowskii]|uniref:Phosphodiesterase n=1 Tax=Spirobacillus cienkowskii TaxID=495820 RepID=A0A369KQZ5_9BACT|nr:MAG: hypothetical protein DCC88_01755 [Spirobacillus cienkowskii]
MLKFIKNSLSIKINYYYFILFTIFSNQVLATDNKEIKKKYVIFFVWDGLRYDILSDKKAKKIIPNLLQLASNGIEFKDHHSAYPTFTMNNAQVFATGDYAGKSGFYGNSLYQPWRTNKVYGTAINSKGNNITQQFASPIFTEDYQILKALDQPNQDKPELHEPLVYVSTLLQEAQKANLITAVVGKSGPAFFQDFRGGGYIIDEYHVWPLTFAKELQNHKYALPKLSPNAYKKNELILSLNNGDPTATEKIYYLDDDNKVSDPTKGLSSPFSKKNTYLSDIYINYILPYKKPDLSILWLRNPDTTEHTYGPGTSAYYDALKENDIILGKIISQLKKMDLYDKTNIIIGSDHSHSTILATKRNDLQGYPQLMYPTHKIINNNNNSIIGNAAENKKIIKNNKKILVTNGYSASGNIRTSDLISKANLNISNGNIIKAYDGGNCSFSMEIKGVRNLDGSINKKSAGFNVADGTCIDSKKINRDYTSPSYLVPENLSNNDNIEKVIIAANGGSDYIYVPSNNNEVINELVKFFQRRQEYSAVFVDEKKYKKSGFLPKGTLPLSYIKLDNLNKRNPDIVVSLTSNPNVEINGLQGTEFESTNGFSLRGNHGSFGRNDVHNILLAFGPSFKSKIKNNLPTGNVDVAPTIAKILEIELPNTDGRILLEALKNSNYTANSYKVKTFTVTSDIACNLEIFEPTTHPINFHSKTKNNFIDQDVDSYYTELNIKSLTLKNGVTYLYFDSAEGKRQKGCSEKIKFTHLN